MTWNTARKTHNGILRDVAACETDHTCGAARPTPSSLYIMSNISSASFLRSSPNAAMRAFWALSRGSGYFTIDSTVRGESHSNFVTVT